MQDRRFSVQLSSHNRFSWGLGISLIAPLYFGLLSLNHVLNHPFIIQDDARLHLVWLQQWIDPSLFPNDLIAHYYTTLHPIGFKALYGLVSQIGIAPLDFAKLVPLALAVVATVYLFQLSQVLLPIPLSGILVTLIFNQNIWLKDDLISATPRAFVYPLFAAFLYYLVRRSPLPCLIVLMLQGLFYPQIMMVSAATLTLRLVRWHEGSLRWSRQQQDYILWGAGVGVAIAILLIFSRTVSSEFGDLVTAAQMQAMPEFGPGGRREYFGVPLLHFWFAGASGLRLPLFPPIIWAAVGLPWVLRSPLDLARQITPQVRLLLDVLLGAIGLFALAHLLFPTLYLPSRYTFYSGRMVMAIAAGLVLTVALDGGYRWWQQRRQTRRPLSLCDRLGVILLSMLAIAIVTLPAVPSLVLPCQSWVIGEHPLLYDFLNRQSKETQVASLTKEADNVPAFARRSVLVSQELALAYHPEFHAVMTERITDLLQAQYSPDLTLAQKVIERYGIDLWMMDAQFDNPTYLASQTWLVRSMVEADVEGAIAQLQSGVVPAFRTLIPCCEAFSEENLLVLDAACIMKSSSDIQSEYQGLMTNS